MKTKKGKCALNYNPDTCLLYLFTMEQISRWTNSGCPTTYTRVYNISAGRTCRIPQGRC